MFFFILYYKGNNIYYYTTDCHSFRKILFIMGSYFRLTCISCNTSNSHRNLNPEYLKMWQYWEMGHSNNQSKMRSARWVTVQCHWCHCETMKTPIQECRRKTKWRYGDMVAIEEPETFSRINLLKQHLHFSFLPEPRENDSPLFSLLSLGCFVRTSLPPDFRWSSTPSVSERA